MKTTGINNIDMTQSEGEALYRSILNASPDGIVISDLESRILMVSTSGLKMLGCDLEEKLTGHFIHELIEPQDRERVSSNIALMFKGIMPGPVEYHGLRVDGSTFYMEINAEFIRDTEVHSTHMIFIIRDITVRKIAQEAIQKRIRALTQPFESGTITFDELFIIDDIQRIQDEFAMATNVAAIITKPDGTPLTAPSNFTYLCSEIIRKNEKGCSNCFKSDAELGRYHPEGPVVQRCLSGGLWDAGASITVGNHHVANWLIGQVRDDSVSEEEMKEYAHEIGVDESAYLEAFRKVPEMSSSHFKHVASALFTLANQLSTTAYQNLQQARFIAERKQAEEYLIENERLLAESQAVVHRDTTNRKKTEEEIQRLNEDLENRVILRTRQLEAVNKELESFSYSVSHDLRAPVRHIIGFSEIIKNECSEQLSEEAKHYLNTISGSAQKMGVLIDDLLSFSRTGRAEITKSCIDMNQVVADALSQVRLSMEERHIDWNVSTMPGVWGDYNLLRQVWINLFDNAVKYTKTRENPVISVGFRDEPDETVFYIYDNGVGFDMRFAHKLFGVFQRLHSISQFDGTGIGLANVRRIISRHGGRTWADAEVDKGATFYFSLPKNESVIISNK
jgi:PAS domain S-box-containing protein